MMNVLNSAHKTLQAYPVIKGGLLGAAAVGIFWYLSDEKRRNKFKQFITNNSLLIITPANVALFATVRHDHYLINKKETVKRWLLFGTILNATIIGIIILKKLTKLILFRNTSKQNTIYQVPPINSSYIKNPLILLIGISKYDETECKQYNMSPKLEGAKVDIDNLTELFTGRYKYKHVYRIDLDYMNKDKDLRDSMVTDSIIQSFCQYYANREKLIELNKPYYNKIGDIDALILYYSGHGCENDWIFCGNGKLLSFYEIKNYFNESKCKYKPLKGKPKLFYLDCCREQIFSKFTTRQNSDIKDRGCGAQDTFNSKEEGNHDATNIYTFYATPNLRSTKERTKKGGYMTNCFIKHFEDAQDKKTLNTMNKLAQKMKLCLKAENRQVGEERNCLVHDNITFIPSV